MKPHFLRSPALWVFVVTFAVRLFVVNRLSDSAYYAPDSGDMKFYSDWALRIAQGEFSDGKAFYGLPGYAFLLASIYWLFGFKPFVFGLIGDLQAVAEAFTAVFIFKIAQEVFGGIRSNLRVSPANLIGIVAALGWAFFQPAQTFSAILMPTAWVIAAFWFCVWRALATKTASIWWPWLGLGLLIGVMAMIVATILFLIPLLAVAIFLNFKTECSLGARLAKSATAIAVVIAAVFAGTSPCWIHNYFIAREPVMLSAHSGLNFYIGNNPIANGYPKIPPGMRAGQEGMLKDSITMAEAGAGRPLKRVEVSQYWSVKARAYIDESPLTWLRLMLVKFANFWNAFQYDDLSLITLFASDHILTPGLRFGFVATLAIPGIVFAIGRGPRAGWVIAASLLQMCALMPVFITERYRLAAVPGFLLMMVYGLWELWNGIHESRWVTAGSYLAICAAAAWFVSWPPSDPGLWSLDYYNTGIKALEVANQALLTEAKDPALAARSLETARRNLELAYRYVPHNSEINFALGNLWLEKGDRFKAKSFYRRAIEINARHSSAHNNLGVIAMDEDRWDMAEKFLLHSIAIEPADAKTHYLLARVKLHNGDRQGAQAAVAEALRLRPQQKEFLALAEEISRASAQP